MQGANGGAETVSLTLSQMPAHNHAFRGVPDVGLLSPPALNGIADKANSYVTEAPNVAMHSQNIGANGGDGPHNNMPPYTVLRCIIALQGIFPPRP